MPQGATSSTYTKATIPSLRPEPPSGYIVPPLTNLAALTPHWHARKDAGHWFHGCPQQDANTDPPMEVAVVSHNLAMSSTGSVATGSNIQGVPIIQPSLFIPQIQPRRQLPIIPRGSLNLLESPDFFWSGQTLEDLCFNDRRLWREQFHPPQQVQEINGTGNLTTSLPTNQQTLNYAHPNEHLHKTSLVDIIEIFRRQRPKTFRQNFRTGPNGYSTPQLLNEGTNGWVLAYLDGTADRALEFREAMLRSSPPTGRDDGYTILDIFCAGIPYVDQDGRQSPIRAALECPLHAKVMVIMRVSHVTGPAEGVGQVGCFYD